MKSLKGVPLSRPCKFSKQKDFEFLKGSDYIDRDQKVDLSLIFHIWHDDEI